MKRSWYGITNDHVLIIIQDSKSGETHSPEGSECTEGFGSFNPPANLDGAFLGVLRDLYHHHPHVCVTNVTVKLQNGTLSHVCLQTTVKQILLKTHVYIKRENSDHVAIVFILFTLGHILT